MNIILIGFKKSGKTILSKTLSLLLKKDFIDIDDVIKKLFEKKYREKKEIFEIYKFLQEKRFRELETLAFEEIKDVTDTIIATSGGCILNEYNLKVLNNPKVVIYLKVSKKSLKDRILRGEKSIFSDMSFFEKEYEKRIDLYENMADIFIETNNLDVVKLSKQIKEKLNV